MIGYSIEVANLPQVDAQFRHIRIGIETLKPLWKQFESQFHAEESDLFSRAPWAPLSEGYAEQKRKQYGNKPILQATGTLLRSLTESKSRGNISRIDDLHAEFGSSIPYGIFHQLGTSVMPERPPLADPDERIYQTIAGRYLDGLMSSAGFN